jgi:hypothetical protein
MNSCYAEPHPPNGTISIDWAEFTKSLDNKQFKRSEQFFQLGYYPSLRHMQEDSSFQFIRRKDSLKSAFPGTVKASVTLVQFFLYLFD